MTPHQNTVLEKVFDTNCDMHWLQVEVQCLQRDGVFFACFFPGFELAKLSCCVARH